MKHLNRFAKESWMLHQAISVDVYFSHSISEHAYINSYI